MWESFRASKTQTSLRFGISPLTSLLSVAPPPPLRISIGCLWMPLLTGEEMIPQRVCLFRCRSLSCWLWSESGIPTSSERRHTHCCRTTRSVFNRFFMYLVIYILISDRDAPLPPGALTQKWLRAPRKNICYTDLILVLLLPSFS